MKAISHHLIRTKTIYAKLAALFVLLLFSLGSQAQICDVDIDGDVDRVDIALIFDARGQTAIGDNDPRDPDLDKIISVRDTRLCRRICTLRTCASPLPNTIPIANAGADKSASLGEQVSLDGSGSSDADGDSLTYLWQIVQSPVGSVAVLDQIDSISPSLTIDLAGDYIIQLIVNDGIQDSIADSVIISSANTAPTADAGSDLSAKINEIAIFDGTGSTDADGDAITYQWSLLSSPAGSAAMLSNATSAMPSLTIDASGDYQVQLVVNDGTVDSAADTVRLSTENSAPLANAGNDLSLFVNDVAVLNGSMSSDVDGDNLRFLWSILQKPNGSSAALSNADQVMPQFTIDEPGRYVAQLIVNDGTIDSTPDTVVVDTQNSIPVANAGPDQSVDLNTIVMLDGSFSSDPDGDLLTYTWSLIAKPNNSNALLNDTNIINPEFNVDLAGTYTAQLVVNDGSIDSLPNNVVISTNNSRPVADAGPDQTPEVGDTVTVDGSLSSDADGDSLGFTWSISSAPAGSNANLTTPIAESSDINIDLPGTYVLQLIVNDGTIDSFADTTVIQTQNRAPEANAGDDTEVTLGEDVILSGAASSDPDADSLTYFWTIVDAPNNSTAMLDDNETIAPRFTPDVQGSYTIELIVNDGELDSAISTVIVTAVPAIREMSINLDSPRVGITRSISGSVSLGAPAEAGGVSVSLVSSNPAIASLTPTSLFIAEGDTSASFDVNGLSEGSSVITATATNYNDASVNITATSALITLGDPGILAPDQTNSLAVSISEPAPAGGLTVFISSDAPNIVRSDASVFIPAGLQVASVNPQLTGDQLGIAKITATSDLFAPDSRDIEVRLDIAFTPNLVQVIENSSSPATISLSAPAPTGGLVLDIVSSDPSIATAPQSVLVDEGELSVIFDIQGNNVGGASLTASANGVTPAELSVTVIPAPPIELGNNQTIGKDLQSFVRGNLAVAAPSGNALITITSNDPSKVLLANTVSGAGAASIDVLVNAGSRQFGFYVHGLTETGTETITASSPGYSDGSLTISAAKSGLRIRNSSFSIRSLSANRAVIVDAVRLNQTNSIVTTQAVRGGFSIESVISSSDIAVGSINSPVNIMGGQLSASHSFDPISAGQTTLNLSQPVGFSTPNRAQEIEVTVTDSLIQMSDVSVGKDLQISVRFNLSDTPPSPVDVQFSVSNPNIAIVSAASNSVGAANATVSGVRTSQQRTITFQGLQKGTTTFTASATGYVDFVGTIEVTDSGFYIGASDYETTSFSSTRGIPIRVQGIDASGAGVSNQTLRAGLSIPIAVTNTDSSVVNVIEPLVFQGNTTQLIANFDPIASGVARVALVTPTSFVTPNNRRQEIEVTVTAPSISLGDVLVGRNLQFAPSISLGALPPTPTDLTITIVDPTIAIVSSAVDQAGSSSIQVPITGTLVRGVFFQGLSEGVTNVELSAPGYDLGTALITVTPGGIVLRKSDFETTSFSTNTAISIGASRLQPGTNIPVQSQQVRGGLDIQIPITNSDNNVGTIESSITISGGGSITSASFDPVSAGTTLIAIGQPAGFTASPSNQQLEATVRAPNIFISDVIVGDDLQTTVQVTLEASPPSPVDVQVITTAAPVATVSDSNARVGTPSFIFQDINNTRAGFVTVQGLSVGTTQVVVSAPGYNDGISEITVVPSGFVVEPRAISTVVGQTNLFLGVRSYRLNPTTLNTAQVQSLRAGFNVDIDLANSNTNTVQLSTDTVTISGASSLARTQVIPISAGSANISLITPTGFDTPSNAQASEVTVNP